MNKNYNPDYFEAMESEYKVNLDFLNGNEFDLNKKFGKVCPTCEDTEKLVSSVPIIGMEPCCDCSETKILKEDNEL